MKPKFYFPSSLALVRIFRADCRIHITQTHQNMMNIFIYSINLFILLDCVVFCGYVCVRVWVSGITERARERDGQAGRQGVFRVFCYGTVWFVPATLCDTNSNIAISPVI